MLEFMNDVFSVLFVIISSIALGLFFSLRNSIKTLDELRDELKNLKTKYQDGEKDISYYKKLLHDVTEQAHRNGAIAEGLAADLAAMKEYYPEDVEEKLRKIREIRAEEERIRQMRAMGFGQQIAQPFIFLNGQWVPYMPQIYNEKVSAKDFSDALSSAKDFSDAIAQMTNAYRTTLKEERS